MSDQSGTTLDVDQIVEAIAPPSIKIRGKVYVGRVCSLLEMLPHQKKFQALDAKRGKDAVGLDELFDAVRGVCGVVGIPAEAVIGLPTPALKAVIASFFKYAAAGPKSFNPPSTPGND